MDCRSRLEALSCFTGKPPALRGLSSPSIGIFSGDCEELQEVSRNPHAQYVHINRASLLLSDIV